MTKSLEIPESELISHYIQNAPQIMWFFGAGTSRTAGMPTATDIIWDLKRRYYCIEENQEIQNHDINYEYIKSKIQKYLDSKGFPALWSPKEYSFYFNLIFRENYSEQQKYLRELLNEEKISLNIGHRVIAALLEMKKVPMIFTTNFDAVIESAFSKVTGKELTTFHLEGSYAALEALNSNDLPIYAKIHGDFRYQSIKNLPQDLISSDENIQKCFLAAANRFGLIVSGYSGRDTNVMEMFKIALEQVNPFPNGIYWTVTLTTETPVSVIEFIEKAKSKNINAYVVQSDTFDILLSKIWRQFPDKPQELVQKVKTPIAENVSIPLPSPGIKGNPILRTNGLLVIEAPKICATLTTNKPITYSQLKDVTNHYKNRLLTVKSERILCWGSKKHLIEALSSFLPGDPQNFEINNPAQVLKENMIIKSFYEEALAKALIIGKPLLLRKFRNRYFAVVDHRYANEKLFDCLKIATEGMGAICGTFHHEIYWAEAVSIRLEEKNGHLWLLLRPDIWVKPLVERQNYREEIKTKKKSRYNNKANKFLDAWITILLGNTGNKNVRIKYYSDTEYPIQFTVNTQTAFSRKEG
ncbi:MAG: SIR2 family protein [Paracoccaceae bacterium]|nr:SIR2 family protein [Paracoccaceae bacterium]MDE2675844.1 SIR2 family protein [Paracoccaceae bacterium]